jgi:hypothetical protein
VLINGDDSSKKTNVQVEGDRVPNLLAEVYEYTKTYTIHNSMKKINRSCFFPFDYLDDLFLLKVTARTKKILNFLNYTTSERDLNS